MHIRPRQNNGYKVGVLSPTYTTYSQPTTGPHNWLTSYIHYPIYLVFHTHPCLHSSKLSLFLIFSAFVCINEYPFEPMNCQHFDVNDGDDGDGGVLI